MSKTFVCYAQRSGAGFRRSIYRTEVSANPITASDPKATITSIANFKTYVATVLGANTVSPVSPLATAATTAINAVIDTFASGVNALLKNNIKISIVPYAAGQGGGASHFVRVVAIKNGVKTTTDTPLVSQPAPAPSPSPAPAPSGG